MSWQKRIFSRVDYAIFCSLWASGHRRAALPRKGRVLGEAAVLLIGRPGPPDAARDSPRMTEARGGTARPPPTGPRHGDPDPPTRQGFADLRPIRTTPAFYEYFAARRRKR